MEAPQHVRHFLSRRGVEVAGGLVGEQDLRLGDERAGDGGPLAAADPEVRAAVETTLAAYGRALESQDAELLARVRPDLRPAERERLLARFRGAINVATDLRVLDVIPGKGVVVVPVLRTDVIVGGRGAPTAPVEETLRFERRDGVWRLAGAGR